MREQGVIRARCRGARMPKKQSLLQPFIPLWVDVYERGHAFFVQKVESSGPTCFIEGQALLAGLYVNELVYHAFQPGDVSERLFDAYNVVLQTLSASLSHPELSGLLRSFEWTLLTEMGYSFAMTHVLPECYYVFIPEEGLVLASHGLKGAHLLGIVANDWRSPLVRQTAKTLLRLALDHALGGRMIFTRTLNQASVND